MAFGSNDRTKNKRALEFSGPGKVSALGIVGVICLSALIKMSGDQADLGSAEAQGLTCDEAIRLLFSSDNNERYRGIDALKAPESRCFGSIGKSIGRTG